MNARGYPVEIVKFNSKKKTLELNLNILKNILLSDDVKDANITVIAVNGPSRRGKSFILNFLLKYLQETYTRNNTNWLENEDSELTGFEWGGGSRRKTMGIWVWSKVFVKVLSSGEKVGILLMDTQGTYDGNSKIGDSNIIFGISTMVASVNVLNLTENISEETLENLKVFVEYGKLLNQQIEEKPFPSILFLVRDWNYPYESSYGYQGGENYLNNILEDTNDEDDDTQFTRNYIKLCTNRLKCFLMPPPSSGAERLPYFKGELKLLNQDFKTNLRSLIPNLLAPENIVSKKINFEPIQGKYFADCLLLYWERFRRGATPPAAGILSTTAKIFYFFQKREAVELYQREMQKEMDASKDALQSSMMMRIHEENLRVSVNRFLQKLTFGDEKYRLEVTLKLQIELKDLFVLYMAANGAQHSQNINQIITDLNNTANSLEAKTVAQTTIIQNLIASAQALAEASEEEKQQLLDKIIMLQQNPLIIIEPGPTGDNRSTKEEIEEEVQRWGDQISDESKRFGKKIGAEYDNFEENFKDIGEKVEDNLSVLGGDIEREANNFGDAIAVEAKNLGDAISSEAKNAVSSVQDVVRGLFN